MNDVGRERDLDDLRAGRPVDVQASVIRVVERLCRSQAGPAGPRHLPAGRVKVWNPWLMNVTVGPGWDRQRPRKEVIEAPQPSGRDRRGHVGGNCHGSRRGADRGGQQQLAEHHDPLRQRRPARRTLTISTSVVSRRPFRIEHTLPVNRSPGRSAGGLVYSRHAVGVRHGRKWRLGEPSAGERIAAHHGRWSRRRRERAGGGRASARDGDRATYAFAPTGTFDPDRSRSFTIRIAASLPGAPITQPPGCVPEPHW